MASDRQKYNFLAALVKQADQAIDEYDDLAHQLKQLVRDLMSEVTSDIYDNIEGLHQRTLECESALEELDGAGSEGSGEEPLASDDGHDYDDLRRDEPPLGGEHLADRRVAPPVGGAGDGQGHGRPVIASKTRVRVGDGRTKKK